MSPDTNGWDQYQRLVLSKLDSLEAGMKELQKEQQESAVDIAMLKVKAGAFGVVGGLLPFGLFVAYQIVGGGA